jgi:hypothetical protein
MDISSSGMPCREASYLSLLAGHAELSSRAKRGYLVVLAN